MDRVLLRLDEKERETLGLVTAALRVSQYTDDVDDYRTIRREDRMDPSLKDFFCTVIGLTVAATDLPSKIRKELEDRGRETSGLTIQPVLLNAFEIYRRYKRLNPDKNRSEYGKLVMILQDMNEPGRLQAFGMTKAVTPLRTVGHALATVGASDLLGDDRLRVATAPLITGATPESHEARRQAKQSLLDEYAKASGQSDSTATAEDATPPTRTPTSGANAPDFERRKLIEQCILSIADVRTFLASNVQPIDKLLSWLDKYFTRGTSKMSIAISSGRGGSMLSHSHETQCQYVKESLTLWRIIQRDIFDFWACVEEDMVIDAKGRYRFCDTGQGFHRMLGAPKTYNRMQQAIQEAHSALGGWVGIKVVHLGDRDVPNALVFIDKYTIIPHLVTPVVQTIERLEAIFDETQAETYPGIRNLLRAKYESIENLRLMILSDFFKHAFDGSGDDGGNCIDGRLTSAWNWCHRLEKKSYYDAFVLTGFTGFDG